MSYGETQEISLKAHQNLKEKDVEIEQWRKDNFMEKCCKESQRRQIILKKR